MEEHLRQELLQELKALNGPLTVSSEDVKRVGQFTSNLLGETRLSKEMQYVNAHAIAEILHASTRAIQF